MQKHLPIIGILFCLCMSVQAQFSIRAGVNFANEKTSIAPSNSIADFESTYLNAYQIGIMYQKLAKIGLGFETGVLFTQKGSSFSYTPDSLNQSVYGYNEVNYIEIPLSLKYAIRFGSFGIYAAAGIYGSCAFSGKTTLLLEEDVKTKNGYNSLKNRLDTGYNLNMGIELFKKIQLGAAWSRSILDMSATEGITQEGVSVNTRNKVWAVTLAYFF